MIGVSFHIFRVLIFVMDGDTLEFETADQCDFYPFFANNRHSYTVALN